MHIEGLQPAGHQALKANQPSPDALRQAAMQFEALLLMQLTSSLNSTSAGDDEDALFGSDGGTSLSKQMFSEQLASSMAQAGGVGLSDVILKQFGSPDPKSSPKGRVTGLSGVISAIKDARDPNAYSKATEAIIGKAQESVSSKNGQLFAGDPNDAEVISTFEEQARTDGVDESMRTLELNGKITNSTRARIVPNAAVNEILGAAKMMPSAVKAENVSYHFPVKGRISSSFGNRFHPIDKKVKFHAGIDIAVPLGTPVATAAAGVVKFAGRDGDYGNLVIVEHADGRTTRYGHLSKILVSGGEQIDAGQEIALSGSTGKSTGPHLHFEVREDGQVVNPIKILANVLPYVAER